MHQVFTTENQRYQNIKLKTEHACKERSSKANERSLMTAAINKAMAKIVAGNRNEAMRKPVTKKLEVALLGMLTHKLWSCLTSNFLFSFIFFVLLAPFLQNLTYSLLQNFFFSHFLTPPRKVFPPKKLQFLFKFSFCPFGNPKLPIFLGIIFISFFSHAVHRFPCSPSFSSFPILSLFFLCLSIASTF